MSTHVIRIKPNSYIHVADNNKNITNLIIGPKTFTRLSHEEVVLGPEKMIMIPPRSYCVIANPIIRDEDGNIMMDEYDNYQLKHGDEEIRFTQDPFPLYPGESLVGKIEPLQVVAANAALKLRSIRDFEDENGVTHVAGDEWLLPGPTTYFPRIEVQVVEVIKSRVIKQNTALKLRAKRKLLDKNGVERRAGEEWLIREPGAYLRGVDEDVLEVVHSILLTDKIALHLKAKETFEDIFGNKRKAGEHWLVTLNDAESHIPDVYEEVVGEVEITTLTNRQYCYILNPYDEETGKLQFGKKELRKGEKNFFLKPGEELENGCIQNIDVLDEEEALLLRAIQTYDDGVEIHKPGDRWMIHGPCDYVPPIEVEKIERRRIMPLDENEGIYVRNIKTGEVRAVIGESYLLKAHEELWEKELPQDVEELLGVKRQPTQVVTYRAPHNSAVQIYDYKAKESRVVFGPELVMLNPDEQFTILSLSAGKPKTQNGITSLGLLLGPDFMTDIVEVETSDHARLSLTLAYNWFFDVEFVEENDIDPGVFFSVPDFVGDACKAIASRVRGAVAGTTFELFHKTSADIIKKAVFGQEENGEFRNRLKFKANHLVITNIDIQSVEPVDDRTRESLQKSVQLAIEITTKSQEASARHEAQRKDQVARGELERQKIHDEAEAEKSRRELLELQAHSAAIEVTGQATAEAKARAQAALIQGEAAVKQSELKAAALKIKFESELEYLITTNKAQLVHQQKLNELEITKAREMAQIEASKFKETVEAIGPDVIAEIARAGPEMQAKLLGSLGLQGMLITDGNSPINLFNTANGLIGGGMGSNNNNVE